MTPLRTRPVRDPDLVRVASAVLLIPFARTPPAEDPAVYRAMFDQAAEGRFVTDPLLVILHANSAATLLFRAAEQALYGVEFPELLAPGSRGAFASALESTRRPPARAGPVALRGRRSDGAEFPIDVEIIHGSEQRYGLVVREAASSGSPERFNPGQMLVAKRIQELV